MHARIPSPGRSTLVRLALVPAVLIGAVVVGIIPELPPMTEMQPSLASNAPGLTSPRASPVAVVRTVLPTLAADGPPFLSQSSHQVRLGDVVMRFDIPAEGWESHGLPYVSKSAHGNQGAEAIVYWTALPRGDSSRACTLVLGPLSRATPQSMAEALAGAPGVRVASEPSHGLLGGGWSTRVDLRVEHQRGCVPGYLVEWEPFAGGAMWEDVQRGDTIRIWFVDVRGVSVIVAAATHADAGQRVTREALAIVDSILFDVIPA